MRITLNRRLLLSLFMVGCCYWCASAQQIAVKTNALYWAMATPNLGAEVALSKHSTISLTANYNPWTIAPDNKIKHWFIQPEYRYWLSEKFTRAYFGVHFVGGEFEIGGFPFPLKLPILDNLHDHYFKGSAIGLGVSFGYDFYISPHWNLEAMIGVGVARLNYHAEPLSAPKGATYKNKVRYLPVPTEVGISFVYLFKSRK